MGIAAAATPTLSAVSVQGSSRISALDFTKGALVVIMVLYHWLNYFIGPHDSRYLRFLTPSFIFITGFFISNVYLSKYKVGNPQLQKRLLQRGLKIIAVFVGLNAVISLLLGGIQYSRSFIIALFTTNAMSVFVTGNVVVAGVGKGVSFFILVPIGYLLVLSAILVVLCKFYAYAFQVFSAAFLVVVLVFLLNDIECANLELVTIGLLGVMVGYVPLGRITAFVQHPLMMIAGYTVYAAAITMWNVTFLLQIVGVLLSLGILYLLGTSEHESFWRRRVILLGKYSLFGYVSQIAILQVLRRGFRPFDLGPAMLAISFILAVILTQLSVEITDRARLRLKAVDSMYRFVFA